jgi:uncharacterized protein
LIDEEIMKSVNCDVLFFIVIKLKIHNTRNLKNFLTAKWQNLIMANYLIEPKVLLPYLPKGVELDLVDGKACASLVGFLFKNSKIFGIPIPGLGTFEEVNLRFYVKRVEDGITKRGVVFINETVPYRLVAWLANILYKEHYKTVPTKHEWKINSDTKSIKYEWKVNNNWDSIFVNASSNKIAMKPNSFEEFIFEHYFGYTKISETKSQEYYIAHLSWQINEVLYYKIKCDFGKMYGNDFAFLNNQEPHSVYLAEGSDIAVRWKRNQF